jgi:hypothetical protein
MEAEARDSRSVARKGAGFATHERGGGEAAASAGLTARLPEKVCASAGLGTGEYDAKRLRSQREIIRDVMLAAAECETWLTLGELRMLTQYGEASISAQLRHLRKLENGGYEVAKRHPEWATVARCGSDGRGECVWEYRMDRGKCAGGPASICRGEQSASPAGI